MRKCSMLIRDANWKSLYHFRCFENRNLGRNSQTLFPRKKALHTPTFYMKLNHFVDVFRKIATLLVLEVWFFQRVHFLGGPFFLRSRVWVRILYLERCLSFCLFYICSTRKIKSQNQSIYIEVVKWNRNFKKNKEQK